MQRFFEILPGALAWLTLALVVIFSWKLPVAVAVFIILFDIYWLLKTIYLSFHLRVAFSRMKENLKIDWLAKLNDLRDTNDANVDWHRVYHVLILPMYREPYEVVRESFMSLAKANYPKDKFIIVLATEARAGSEARVVAEKIKQEFEGKFFSTDLPAEASAQAGGGSLPTGQAGTSGGRFIITTHPQDMPGEIPGKGSNETWAAKEVKRLVIDPLRLNYDNILVSVFDIDTQVPREYFGRLTYVFLNAENRLRAIYQPVPLYINNIYQAPALSRIISFSNTFWHMMQQVRPERLRSYSSQSLPFRVLVDVGFWHTDVVSEDSRIFFQGYLHYHGEFRTEPLHFPVYMDANVSPAFWQTMENLYKQIRRWGWGVENIPYMMCGKHNSNDANDGRMPRIVGSNSQHSHGFVDSHYREGFLYDKKIPWRKKWYWSFIEIEGFHSWATNSLMIFALGWLPLMLGGSHFNESLLAYGLPRITRFIVAVSMIGIVSSAILSVALFPPRPKGIRRRHYALYIVQWILLPITLIVFGAFPGLEAQTRLMLGGRFRLGFWVTPKHRNNS